MGKRDSGAARLLIRGEGSIYSVAKLGPFRGLRAVLAAAVLVLGAGAWVFTTLRAKDPAFPIVVSAQNAGPIVRVPDKVATFRPVVKATLPDGVSDQVLQQVRSVPGVQAAAAVLLSTLSIQAPGGETEVSVAGVDPEDFRPLTPQATAHAPFVWEGLMQSKAFIANEEYQILGGEPIRTLAATIPAGRRNLTVGGVATNGLPSLAGVLMSMAQAEKLGLGSPTLLLIGVGEATDVAKVAKDLSAALPGIRFESMLPPADRTFYSGPAAQKAIGRFQFTTNPDGTINQDSKWIKTHLVGAKMPIIGSVRCHRLMIPQLRLALEDIQNQGLSNLLKPEQAGRCYQPRFVEEDPTRQLSKHAWGLAIDLNVSDNPEGSTSKMDPRIVSIFEKWGFRWGGRWTKPDGMHFELAAVLKE